MSVVPAVPFASPSAPSERVPVLIVDDNPAKRTALKASLAPLGYDIVEADCGIDALRCVMAQDFAVILLDVRMPVMDGYEVASRLRQRKQSEDTPIIFVTAHAKEEVRPDLYEGGAVDVIFAPVVPSELRAKVSIFAALFLKASQLATRAAEVQASADQLRLLTDAAPVGIFQTDSQRRLLYTNPRWSEITGIAASDARGRSLSSVVESGQWDELTVAPLSGRAPEPELSGRFRIGSPDSDVRIVAVTARSIVGVDGSPAGWVGTLADISAEAGAEAALSEARDEATEASKLKSDFLAHMSHEIRTPMNGVIGMTDLLLDSGLDAHQLDYVETMRDAGDALMVVINNILDFSKIEAGMLQLDSTEFSVQTVLDDVVDLLAASAQVKEVELLTSIDSSGPLVVCGDPGRVRQVVMNLAGNAVKFTAAGAVVVRVTAVEPVGEELLLRFEVSDTGDGIEPEMLQLIFQPFVQADSSTSRKYGGTGLGLAISADLVALMGGECGVTSELGVGSCFWFTIRVQAAAPAAASPLPPSEPVARMLPARVGSGRLLLAEDNVINQKVAVAMLSKAGYQVDTVLDGVAAVKAFSDHSYDAILMDCQMPELNGYEATAAIRAQEGPGFRIPIIAMTAGARKVDRERCLASGMDDYIAKPVRKDTLLTLVARLVEGGQS